MLPSLRHAIRRLLKSPGFVTISMVTLALGIGINTTAFTVLNRFLFQALPFRDSGRLIQIYRTTPQQNDMRQAPGDFFDEREQSNLLAGATLYYVDGASSLELDKQPAQLATLLACDPDFFTVMGIAPVIGRAFSQDDAAHHAQVVLLSNAFWRKNYGADPQVIGKTLRLNGSVATIIGVMSPVLDDPMIFGGNLDLWHLDNADVNRNMRDKSWYLVAGRLKAGATIVQAQAQLNAVAARLAHDFPKTNSDRGFRVIKYPTNSVGDLGEKVTWMIMDLALVVLLIACVNLANLQLVRTTGRSRELAIRLALGASRARLTGMLLLESLILSLAGGALGLLVADWGNAYLAVFFKMEMPLDARVLGFAVAASTFAGVLFGTLPAWTASRSDVNSVLKQGGRSGTADRSRHRTRNALVVAQLAMALILLTGAGYFVRGLQRLTINDRGWRPENLLIGFFVLPHDRFGEEQDERSRVFGDKFRADLGALPGVDHVGITQGFPLLGDGSGGGFLIEGRPVPPKGKEPVAATSFVSPGFFPATGIRVEQGRDFTDADRTGSVHVAIISHSMAQKYWPGENAIGKRIGDPDQTKPDWLEIVGIVNDTSGMIDVSPMDSHYEIYRAWDQNSFRQIAFWLHSTHDPHLLEDGVRKTLSRVEPEVAFTILSTADEFMDLNLGGILVVRRLLIQIAVLGLLLSAVGIYGVIASLASERTQEVGIRLALGAQRGDVLWLFLRNGIKLALLGAGIGLVCSIGLMTLLTKAMPIIPGNDPRVVVFVTLLMCGVAIVSCWLPARKATRVSPIEALRGD